MAKIMALIALIAIVLGIVWTGMLVIASSFGGGSSELSQEEIREYLDSFSGSTTATGTWTEL